LTAVGLGAFMLLIDVTIVNVALPDMTADLGASFADLQWVVDIYALTLAALLLGIGALGDRLGHRRVYIAGLVITWRTIAQDHGSRYRRLDLLGLAAFTVTAAG
jgi:MFS family permease